MPLGRRNDDAPTAPTRRRASPDDNDEASSSSSSSSSSASSRFGVLPVVPDEAGPSERGPRNNAATAASAAGARALSAQLVAFYFRAPAKAFFRTRVDYLAYARALHEARTGRLLAALAAEQRSSCPSSSGLRLFLRRAWLWARGTTPGVLTSAVRLQGWGVIPHQVLPPLVANVGVGAVLYTSYLHILGRLHEESARAGRAAYPPPPPAHTFAAGLLAGALQSVVAAPLDALQARYDHRDLVAAPPPAGGGRPRSLWAFGADKLREIGLRGVFAGWGLSLAKDSLGSALFFTCFEYVKAQAYYRFVTWYYGGLGRDAVDALATRRPTSSRRRDHDHNEGDDSSGNGNAVIHPHYAIEPMFLLCAGIGASLAQQLLLHPLTNFQLKHWDHLEDLDAEAARRRARRRDAPPPRRWGMLRAYYHAYRDAWAACVAEAAAHGQRPVRWLCRGFWSSAIRQVPSTSAGLIIFELIRRKYGYDGAGEVRISKDGYDILLN